MFYVSIVLLVGGRKNESNVKFPNSTPQRLHSLHFLWMLIGIVQHERSSMEKSINSQAHLRTKEIALCALSIALMAVSAWITIPFGPIPFTLQTLAIMFVLFALTPKCALISIAGYLVLGAVGLPVFSSFKGSLAALFGPTGGFITGFLIAGACALAVAFALKRIPFFTRESSKSFFGTPIKTGVLATNIATGIIFLVVLYAFGWFQLMIVGNLSPEVAFAAAVAPFVGIDAIKMVAAILLAQAVGNTLKN